MKPASSNDIKQELKNADKKQLIEMCLRLARFKKENKELLSFLLFESSDLQGYLDNVKEEIKTGFSEVNTRQLYLAKKTVRKVLRRANQHIRYTGDKGAEADILLSYLENFIQMNFNWERSNQLMNIYRGNLKKIKAAISAMHEDLQRDYQKRVNALEEEMGG